MKPPTKDHKLTGSRAFGVAGHNSDWDWIGPHPGFGREWSRVEYQDCNWTVYTNGVSHVIAPHNAVAKRQWMAAHRHCMIERPRSKARRKVIFDHYLYGMPLHRNEPIPRRCRPLWKN